MKKALIIALCAILVLGVGGGITAKIIVPSNIKYDIDSIEKIGSSIEVIAETEDTITVKNSQDRALKVLAFTDLHLDGKNDNTNITISHLVENIKREKPDLVVLGGDTITNIFNEKRSRQFCEIFEKFEVYWTGVLGNHEGEAPFMMTRTEMVDLFSSYEHCLMLKGLDEIWGDCNYTLNILNKDDSLCQTLVFMDTGDEVSDEYKEKYSLDIEKDYYDGVKENQVQWYKDKMSETLKEYKDASSILFIHIPLPQYKTQAEKADFLFGEKLENICSSGFDTGLFEAIKQMKTTKAVFCGHDHLNNFTLMCEGILLGYMEPSGYSSYTAGNKLGYEEKDWLQGYMILNLEKDGTYTYEHIKNSSFLEK